MYNLVPREVSHPVSYLHTVAVHLFYVDQGTMLLQEVNERAQRCQLLNLCVHHYNNHSTKEEKKTGGQK